MRKSRRLVSVAAGAASLSLLAPLTKATGFNWSSTAGGTYDWTVNGNWGGAGHPTGAANAGDDANILVNATGDINIAIPAGNYYINSLTLGATGSAQTINVGNGNSGTGQLIFDGGGSGNGVYGRIISQGAAGSTNIISAPIQLDQTAFYSGVLNGDINSGSTTYGNFTVHTNGTLNSMTFMRPVDTGIFASLVADPSSTNDITLTGTLSQAAGVNPALANAMAPGRTLNINGPIAITNAASATAQTFTITGTTGSRTVINGVIGDGPIAATLHSAMSYGNTNPSKTTVYPALSPTIVINSANTYTGLTTMNMATFVLGNDQAFGTAGTVPGVANGEIRIAGSANEFGYNFMTDSDARNIANGIKLGQFLNVTGSNSMTLSGYIYQQSNRGLLNTLPAGKTLTISGASYSGLVVGDGARTWMLDGSGLTIDSGPVYNNANGPAESAGSGIDCPLNKQGTGTVLLNNTGNTLRGATTVNGGLLQFAAPGSYGFQDASFVPTGVFNGGAPTYTSGNIGTTSVNGTASVVVTTGGAVGVATGSTTADFLSRFVNASVGSLALAPADAAVNLDFTNATPGAGNMGGVGTVGMSIGAGNTPVTYTGTITPAANTYRLGGGGTLTLPNAQLTGAGNSLVVTNGGTVALNGINSYGGSTTIAGSYIVSNTNGAIVNDFSGPLGGFEQQTLSVSHLGPAAAASSIGSSSNLPSSLVINGATLKYTGTGDATDRLFTMSGAGATLDSSGTGAVNFNNTGAIVQTDAPAAVNVTVGRTFGSGAPFNTTTLPAGTDLSQLAVGMTVTDTAGALAPYAPVTILGIGGNRVLYLSFQPASGFLPPAGDTLNFTVQNRTLTLAGSNTGANTLAAALTNSGAGTLGVSKTGTGTWFLSGTSTYSGNTTVSGGILEFTTAAAYGNTSSITAKTNGAVGLDTSSLDAAFLAKFTASGTASTGALALAPADAAANVNFTTSPLSGANLVGMSVGAVSAGISYTGTITPAASTYRLGGGGVLTLPNTNALTGANSVVVTNSGAGVVLSGPNNYSGNTNVNSGSLTVAASGAITASNTINVASGATLNANGSLPATAAVSSNGTTNFGGTTAGVARTQALASLAIGAGATVTITPSTFPFTPTLVKPTSTTFAAGAKIDIGNNAFATTGTAAGALAQIQSGQIFSSQPASPNNAIGYINLGGADTGKYEVRYTLKGDTDLSGGVDVGDLGALATSYGISGGMSWANGDFNQDSNVDVGDLGALATNYGTQLATSPSLGEGNVANSLAVVSAAAVPEPASFGLLGIGAVSLLSRRRRR